MEKIRRYKVKAPAEARSDDRRIKIELNAGQIWEMEYKKAGVCKMRWKCVTLKIAEGEIDKYFREVEE